MNLKFANSAILYVDDESKSLRYFSEFFEGLAPIYTAGNGEEGFRVFQEHRGEIGLVLSDQRMPDESGIAFLERIRETDSSVLRVLVTAFTDLNMAVDALNDGLLYSYMTKPWDPGELEGKLTRALGHFCLTRERDKLLKDKEEVVNQLMMAEKAATIGVLSAGLNHHLRNALTVIQPFIDMLPSQLQEEIGAGASPKDSSFWGEYYGDVVQQLEKIRSMLSSLSGGTPGHLPQGGQLQIQEDVDLVTIFKAAAMEELQSRESVQLVIRDDDEVPPIAADFLKISRMASLLIHESLMNIGGEGTIEITVESASINSPNSNAVRVRCMDNGRQIPESERGSLFDPFFVKSDRPGDVGMNLMTCYLTVFAHGGTIKAEGTEDGKNVIDLVIPVKPTDPPNGHAFQRLFDSSSHIPRLSVPLVPESGDA